MIVDELKKSILEYAISGLLSKQNLNEHINIDIREECQGSFDIPSNWRWAKLNDICTLVRGNGIKKSEVTDEGIQCIRYGELYTYYSYSFCNAVSYVPISIAKNCKEVKHGDLLITLTGENEYDIAKATAYMGKEKLVCGGDLAILTNHNQNPMYLSYLFASPYLIGCKSKTAKGNIIVHTSTDKIGDYLIPLPPLEEQQRIVDKIEELFAKLDELKPIEDELNELKKNFPGEMRKAILNAYLHGTDKNLPEKWQRKKCKEILNVTTGKKDANFADENGSYVFFTCSSTPSKAKSYSFEGEYIILPGNGANVGLSIYVDDKFEAYQRTYVVSKKNENINMKYISYYFKSYWSDFNKDKMYGSAIPYIKLGNFDCFEISLPPLEEQRRIVEKLDQLLPLCDDIENTIEINC